MTTYVYAMTRSGEAQHAAEHDGRRAAAKTACGQSVHTAYGPAFEGERGIQHPWKCDKCDRAIRAAAATADDELRRLTIGELRAAAAASRSDASAIRDELRRRRDGEGLVTSLAALEGRLLELAGASDDERREVRAVVLELNALLEHAGLPVPAVVDEYDPRANWGAW